MNDHTPGPWRYEMQGNYARLFFSNPHDGDVLCGYCGEANARLIAAAPNMLSALRDVETLLDCGNIEQSHWDDALAVIRSAITKATGAAP